MLDMPSLSSSIRSQPPSDNTAAAGDDDDAEALKLEPDEQSESSAECTSWTVVSLSVCLLHCPASCLSAVLQGNFIFFSFSVKV